MFGLTRQEQVTIGVLALLVASVVIGLVLNAGQPERGRGIDLAMNTGDDGTVQSSAGGTVLVHVAGRVEASGVYELPQGARVNDAVLKARPLRDADLDALNLAARVHDGQKIVVPAFGSTATAREAMSGGASGGSLIDLNAASQTELETLPGIGPVRAKSIVAYRQRRPFRQTEDVVNVPGIGPGIYEQIRDRVVVR